MHKKTRSHGFGFKFLLKILLLNNQFLGAFKRSNGIA